MVWVGFSRNFIIACWFMSQISLLHWTVIRRRLAMLSPYQHVAITICTNIKFPKFVVEKNASSLSVCNELALGTRSILKTAIFKQSFFMIICNRFFSHMVRSMNRLRQKKRNYVKIFSYQTLLYEEDSQSFSLPLVTVHQHPLRDNENDVRE